MAISLDNIKTSQVNNSGKSNQSSTINKNENGAGHNNSSSTTVDKLSLTDSAKLIQQLEKRLEQQPVVDTQRVSEVRENINSGNYIISSEKVAEKFALYESYFQAAS